MENSTSDKTILDIVDNGLKLELRERTLSMQERGRGEGWHGGFYKFSKKYFVAQETIDLNIPCPSNFLRKYFMAPPIIFSFLIKVYLQQYFRVVLRNIQISNRHRS